MELIKFLERNRIPYEKNVSLANKSWIKFGGIAALWISPTSVIQLEEVCRYLYTNTVNFDLVGQTSNIFFHSSYNPQVVVSTVKINQYRKERDVLICDCGCNLMKLAKEMLSEGYAGFYGLVGLPGTVASAAVNNAECFDCSVSSMLINANVLMSDGTVKTLNKDAFGYKTRSSRFKRGELKGVVLSVKLLLKKVENVEVEIKKSEEMRLYRKTYQEGPAKNLGSVFFQMRRKRNLKNLIARLIAVVAEKIAFDNQKIVEKRLLLYFYGYNDLYNYISDKQINTFVWRDADAELKFVRYKEFMGKVFSNLFIEIEERL